MGTRTTSVGRLLLEDVLPESVHDELLAGPIDKSRIKKIFSRIASERPEEYREIMQRVMALGADVSTLEGSSFRLSDFRSTNAKKAVRRRLAAKVDAILDNPNLSKEQKDAAIIAAATEEFPGVSPAVMEEAGKRGNRLVEFARSGARGGPSSVNQLIGASLMVTDNANRVIPIPIVNNFSEGLSPAELWATSYGVRKGYVDLKSATPKAGYFGKQLAGALHKLRAGKGRPLEGTGLPVDPGDPDNEGAVLARDVDGIPAGTILTTKLLKHLARKKRRILVHSPISSFSPNPGIPAVALGVRENGNFASDGDFVGITAAQAIAEPLAQSAISSKHVAGVVGASGGGSSAETSAGFDAVDKLVNIPKTFAARAAISEVDGVVSGVQDAPQGGKYVYVGKEQYYVPQGFGVQVHTGQHIEAGDVLSDGLPDPSVIAKHKGIGEGRRVLLDRFFDTLRRSGVSANRRNVELAATGLLRHVRVTASDSPIGLPGDVLEYEEVARKYTPRKGAAPVSLNAARGKYLEQPVLHYSIGTRVTPSVQNVLKEFDISDVLVHENAPDFEPDMQRAVDSLAADRDWKVNLAGFGLSRSLQKVVHRGASSSHQGTSYIPGLAASLAISDQLRIKYFSTTGCAY